MILNQLTRSPILNDYELCQGDKSADRLDLRKKKHDLPDDGLCLEVDAGEGEDLVGHLVVPGHLLLLLRHPKRILSYLQTFLG